MTRVDGRARLGLMADEGLETTRLGWKPARSESRQAVAQCVEYSPYPRRVRGERRRVGSSCNRSPSGLCLLAREPEPVGSQLRITLRDVDGHPTLVGLARVIWSEQIQTGWHRIGLALVEKEGRRMLRVRYPERGARVVGEALGA